MHGDSYISFKYSIRFSQKMVCNAVWYWCTKRNIDHRRFWEGRSKLRQNQEQSEPPRRSHEDIDDNMCTLVKNTRNCLRRKETADDLKTFTCDEGGRERNNRHCKTQKGKSINYWRREKYHQTDLGHENKRNAIQSRRPDEKVLSLKKLHAHTCSWNQRHVKRVLGVQARRSVDEKVDRTSRKLLFQAQIEALQWPWIRILVGKFKSLLRASIWWWCHGKHHCLQLLYRTVHWITVADNTKRYISTVVQCKEGAHIGLQ